MPNPAQPPGPTSDDSVVFRKFVGLKNVVSEERLGPDELANAVNVDLDDVGEIRRRRGYTPVGLSGYWSSIYTADQGLGITVGINNGTLGIINPDFSFYPLQGGFDNLLPLCYVTVDENIYWACKTQSGIINQKTRTNGPWQTPPPAPPTAIVDPLDPRAVAPSIAATDYWLSPVVNPTATLPPIRGKLYGPPPFATALTYYNGRIYMAQGKTLWSTELWLYNWVDKTRNFAMFEGEITMLGTVTDGIYVGTTEGLYFLSHATRVEGHPPGAMKRVRVLDNGVVPGSMVYIPGELGNPAQIGLDTDQPMHVSILFLTNVGYCVAQDSGVSYNLSEEKFVFPFAKSAAAMYRFQDGVHQYVATVDSNGSPVANTRIGDYVDATLRKAGSWDAEEDNVQIGDAIFATVIYASGA